MDTPDRCPASVESSQRLALVRPRSTRWLALPFACGCLLLTGAEASRDPIVLEAHDRMRVVAGLLTIVVLAALGIALIISLSRSLRREARHRPRGETFGLDDWARSPLVRSPDRYTPPHSDDQL